MSTIAFFTFEVVCSDLESDFYSTLVELVYFFSVNHKMH